jgi:hypothetical protein
MCGHRDLARQFDQVNGEPKSKDRFVRQDVCRRGRGVTGDDKMGDELLSEDSRHYRGQIETTRHSRLGLR